MLSKKNKASRSIAKKDGKKPKIWEEDMMDDSLIALPKICPRQNCGSKVVKFWMFANGKLDQPRYMCTSCNKAFTLGGILYSSSNQKTIGTQLKSSCVSNEQKVKKGKIQINQNDTIFNSNHIEANKSKLRIYKKKVLVETINENVDTNDISTNTNDMNNTIDHQKQNTSSFKETTMNQFEDTSAIEIVSSSDLDSSTNSDSSNSDDFDVC